MSQFLHAGIIAGGRQLAALVALTLVLLLVTPQDQFTQYSSAPNRAEIFPVSAVPLFTWAALLVALGFALTSSRSICVTASRIQRASRFQRTGSAQYILMALVAQFGLAAILFAVFALQAPPNAIIVASHYFGFSGVVSIIWTATMSVGVASFGASAHSARKAIEHHDEQ
ncbi:MAG: hypothetical protein WCE72_22430 [Pseudolabrys sp.]